MTASTGFFASRPVTIERVRYGELWFPYLFRQADGMLQLTVQYGHDADWSPAKRMQSADGGRTWQEMAEPVPRPAWCHGFADGELFVWDTYGIQDPRRPTEAVYWGSWSYPARTGDVPRGGRVRVEAPDAKPACLTAMRGYPTFHWWELWNSLHGTDRLTGAEIFVNGPYFTDGVELADGRLLALGYYEHRDLNKCCTWCFESGDRGHTWRQVGLVTAPEPAAPLTNEATLVQLRDGRLYSVLRTAGPLVHSWSEDEGRTWSAPVTMKLVDSDHVPAHVWPVAKVLHDGSLALVYGRPGKHLILDPTGTGTGWGQRLDLHRNELDWQERSGVPAGQRLRGIVGHDIHVYCNRHTDSGDYLALVETAPGELLAMYDVHGFVEHWNDLPHGAVRMVRVQRR